MSAPAATRASANRPWEEESDAPSGPRLPTPEIPPPPPRDLESLDPCDICATWPHGDSTEAEDEVPSLASQAVHAAAWWLDRNSYRLDVKSERVAGRFLRSVDTVVFRMRQIGRWLDEMAEVMA